MTRDSTTHLKVTMEANMAVSRVLLGGGVTGRVHQALEQDVCQRFQALMESAGVAGDGRQQRGGRRHLSAQSNMIASGYSLQNAHRGWEVNAG